MLEMDPKHRVLLEAAGLGFFRKAGEMAGLVAASVLVLLGL
jgi:hypothetical protein